MQLHTECCGWCGRPGVFAGTGSSLSHKVVHLTHAIGTITKTIIRAYRWLVPCRYRRKLSVGAATGTNDQRPTCSAHLPVAVLRVGSNGRLRIQRHTFDMMFAINGLGEIPVRTDPVSTEDLVTQETNSVQNLPRLGGLSNQSARWQDN